MKIVIIAGSGRSGTTWVQDSIAEANNLRTLFEPLNPVALPAAKKFAYKYVEEHAERNDLKLYMDQVLSGCQRSLWIDYRIRTQRFNCFRVGVPVAVDNVKRLIRHYRKYRGKGGAGLAVKFIRANLMLPWLVRQYQVPALFITRHPCAVIASRLKLGGDDWVGQRELERYRSDPELAGLLLNRFGVDIKQPFSAISALTCVWCIENLLPIHWASKAGYLVSSYERLIVDSNHEWERVITGLGLSHVPDSSIREIPSQQAPFEMKGESMFRTDLGKWRKDLSKQQLVEINQGLNKFSCSVYTIDEDMPDLADGGSLNPIK